MKVSFQRGVFSISQQARERRATEERKSERWKWLHSIGCRESDSAGELARRIREATPRASKPKPAATKQTAKPAGRALSTAEVDQLLRELLTRLAREFNSGGHTGLALNAERADAFARQFISSHRIQIHKTV